MSALKSRSNSLAGLTLDAVLGGEPITQQQPASPPSPPPPLPQKSIEPHHTTTTTTNQTLFDIIREEYNNKEGHKDRTTWQIFREKLRLKRAGSAWTSSLPIPASDILIPNPKHLESASRSKPGGLSNDKVSKLSIPMSDSGRAMFTRGSSRRVASGKNPENSPDVSVPGDGPPSRSFKPQLSRHDSVRDHSEGEEDSRRRHPVVTFVEERTMSAREAVAAQIAAEAEAAANASDDEDDEDDDEEDDDGDSGGEGEDKSLGVSAPKQTMSLMDLLQETDRQMGLTGSRYAMEEEEEYEEEEEEEEEGDGEGELSCCVCMVKIKGASFAPCGHTFCKLCSKELMAQKGHCPVCSSFVLEFLEIF